MPENLSYLRLITKKLSLFKIAKVTIVPMPPLKVDCQNDHYLGNTNNFDDVLSPSLHLIITNVSLCHRSFFLNTSSLD